VAPEGALLDGKDRRPFSDFLAGPETDPPRQFRLPFPACLLELLLSTALPNRYLPEMNASHHWQHHPSKANQSPPLHPSPFLVDTEPDHEACLQSQFQLYPARQVERTLSASVQAWDSSSDDVAAISPTLCLPSFEPVPSKSSDSPL
jgi:hypothetical protein